MSIFFAKNFKYSEIMCPCGCGKIKPIDPKLSFLLQSLREKISRPIYISKGGGLRCKSYNKRIGGYERSPHVPYYVTIKKIKYLIGCRAVDIHAKNMGIIDLAIAAKDIGFTRIGLYPYSYFVHVDIVRPYRSASWVRDVNGNYIYFKNLEEAIEFIKNRE